MAGQGSINPYQAPSPAIQGIAAALQAVQSYYGIDTAKAQQKLLGVQTEVEQGKVDEAKKLSSELDAVQSGGQPGVRAAKELGLSYVPATGGKKAVVPTADQPVSPLSAAIQGVNAGEAAGTGASPLAVNNMTASDAPQSAFGGSIKTISQATRPQSGASSRKAIEVDASGTPLYARGTVTDANGNVQGYWVDNKQQAADLANEKTRVDTAKARAELADLPRERNLKVMTAYTAAVGADMKKLDALQEFQGLLLSGNPISESLASKGDVLAALGIKRANSGLFELGENAAVPNSFVAFLNKATTGSAGPVELHQQNENLNNLITETDKTIKRTANKFGDNAPAMLGMSKKAAMDALFLPGGTTGANPVKTEVQSRSQYNSDGSVSSAPVLMRLDGERPKMVKPPDMTSTLGKMVFGAAKVPGAIVRGVKAVGPMIPGGE